MPSNTEPPAAPPTPQRTLLLVVLLLCGLVLGLYPGLARLRLGEWSYPFDDPWIHQVYARNLAQLGEYAFNPGETSSGSSAPLWTLLLTPAYWLGIDPFLWSMLLGTGSLALLGALSWRWAERHLDAPLPLLFSAAILLTPQISWTGVEGMETALVAALALAILYRLDGPNWSRPRQALVDGLLNGLLLWLRPEGPLLTLIVAWQRRRENPQFLLAFGAGVAALAAPYAGLHLVLTGRPLPQTVYAKLAYYQQPLSLGGVAAFLKNLLLIGSPGVLLLGVLLLPLALRRMAREGRWPWGPALTWAGLTVLLAALRLPVVLHFGRHFAPVLPPLLLAGGSTLRGLAPRGRQALLLLGGCLLLIGLAIGVPLYIGSCQQILSSQVAMGRWIDANLPSGIPIATHDIGAIGYFGQHPVVDTLALITPELTPIVASGDSTALLDYLRQQQAPYLATLEHVYQDIRELPSTQVVVRIGRMELLELR